MNHRSPTGARGRLGVAAIVIAVHACGLWAWIRTAPDRPPRATAPADRAVVRLHLLPADEPGVPNAPPRLDRRDRSDRPERRSPVEAFEPAATRTAPTEAAPAIAEAIKPTSPVTSPRAAAEPAADAGATPPSDPSSRTTAPLDWTLPRDAAARSARQPINPAVARQIGGRATLSGGAAVEAAIANALPAGRWVEEAVDSDTRIFRRGDQCFVARRPRSEAVDPFNGSGAGGKPWVVGPC